jgi:N-methylhydantoinase A
MAAAADMAERSASVHREVGAFAAGADGQAAVLAAQVEADLPGAAMSFVAECRYAGQGYELDVPCATGAWAGIAAAFRDIHQRAFGHSEPGATVEVVALRGIGRVAPVAQKIGWPRRSRVGGMARLAIRTEAGVVDAAGYDWDGLVIGQTIQGPAVIAGRNATAFVPQGWTGEVNRVGAILAGRGNAESG